MPMPTIPKQTVSLGATARNLIGASETPAAAALSSMNSRRDQLRGGRCVMGALPEIRLGENNALLLMVLSSISEAAAPLLDGRLSARPRRSGGLACPRPGRFDLHPGPRPPHLAVEATARDRCRERGSRT